MRYFDIHSAVEFFGIQIKTSLDDAVLDKLLPGLGG